ncbi:hypothetical protein Plhal304r1_c056g0141721 [Plasmopara halstedii]
MRVPFVRSKKVASSVTDNLDQSAARTEPPPISGTIIDRSDNPLRVTESSASRATSALASLTRFNSRPANHLAAKSSFAHEKANDAMDFNTSSMLSLPYSRDQ